MKNYTKKQWDALSSRLYYCGFRMKGTINISKDPERGLLIKINELLKTEIPELSDDDLAIADMNKKIEESKKSEWIYTEIKLRNK